MQNLLDFYQAGQKHSQNEKGRTTMNRRRFIEQSAFGLSGATFWSCGNGQSLVKKEKVSVCILDNSRFRFGFQSYSLRHFVDTNSFSIETDKLGLSFVEVYKGHLPVDSSDEKITTFKQVLDKIKVKINAFGVEAFSANHTTNEKIFQFGQKLGIENLSADPTKDSFDSLQKLVRQYNIRIAIHNHGPEDNRWQRPEWILESVKNLDPRIGACVDTGHYLRANVDPVEAIRILGSRVLGVHLKDFDASSKEQIPGQGQLNLTNVFQALLDVGFDGVLSLEYEAHKKNPVPYMWKGIRGISEALKQIP